MCFGLAAYLTNFQFNSDGSASTFVPDATGLGVYEQRVAAVQPAPNSAFPLSTWNLGDIFIGAPGGVVVKIVGATTLINWITLPESDTPMQTVFDRTGTVFNGDLIVSFSQSAYRVNASGYYSLIIKDSSLANYEGLEVVPTNDARYGPLSGSVLIPQNTNPYYGKGNAGDFTQTSYVASIKNGVITNFYAGCYVDQIWFVHDYDNCKFF
jgi:hypothetical protein